MSEAKSDIGNLYNFIREYNTANEKAFSYLSGSWPDFEAWRLLARDKVIQSLHYFPEKAPLDPITLEVIQKDGYRQEEVEFSSGRNVRIRGTILIPEDGKEIHAAVVALHDHGGFYYYGKDKILEMDNQPKILSEFKDSNYSGRSWANDLVQRGYVVLAIDSFYFGSRKLDISSVSDEMFGKITFRSLDGLEKGTDEYIQRHNGICYDFEVLLMKHILTAGTSWAGILSYDDRTSVDYLLSRKEVDKERIGCCGLSIGGFRSAMLAGTDPRIKASVITGWMPTMDSLLFDRLRNHTFMVYIMGLAKYMDYPDMLSTTCPNPLFIQQCIQDSLYHMNGMQAACDKIKEIYQKENVTGNFRSEFYDNGHQFNLTMQQDAFDWLDRFL